MTPMPLMCSIYKSSKQDEMYLYVNKKLGLEVVPEALLARFGTPKLVLDLMMKPGRTLARVDAEKVREALNGQGWYLQLPPPADDDLYLSQRHALRAP
ncbi:YcgL domain-containing protein [Isoalcanivorax beigongshangi]|uniref:YcgL domain-containing protein AB5I84_08485 n=1 Tax=Isoalcanivorax beigongshangi TaxID=3238810 RepID=A0ABV4AI09_9GAMM